MNYLIYSGIGIASVYCLYSYGKNRLYSYIMEKVNEELNKRMEQEEELFIPFHKNSSAILKITQGGKTYSVYVPYDRRKSTAMLRKKFYLVKNNEEIEIQQKPGIPYWVTAEQLGGESIIVKDNEGNIIKQFEKNELPKI